MVFNKIQLSNNMPPYGIKPAYYGTARDRIFFLFRKLPYSTGFFKYGSLGPQIIQTVKFFR